MINQNTGNLWVDSPAEMTEWAQTRTRCLVGFWAPVEPSCQRRAVPAGGRLGATSCGSYPDTDTKNTKNHRNYLWYPKKMSWFSSGLKTVNSSLNIFFKIPNIDNLNKLKVMGFTSYPVTTSNPLLLTLPYPRGGFTFRTAGLIWTGGTTWDSPSRKVWIELGWQSFCITWLPLHIKGINSPEIIWTKKTVTNKF